VTFRTPSVEREAALLGELAFKWKLRKSPETESKTPSNPTIMSDRVQICRKKSTLYSVVQCCEVPLEDEALGLKPDNPSARNLPGAVTNVQMTSGKISGEPPLQPAARLWAARLYKHFGERGTH
jgi:hypothetical protein